MRNSAGRCDCYKVYSMLWSVGDTVSRAAYARVDIILENTFSDNKVHTVALHKQNHGADLRTGCGSPPRLHTLSGLGLQSRVCTCGVRMHGTGHVRFYRHRRSPKTPLTSRRPRTGQNRAGESTCAREDQHTARPNTHGHTTCM